MLPEMSVEGGMSGHQQRFVCGNCGKIFFAWRPDTRPGQKIKCYFCKREMEDEAASRTVAPPAESPKSDAPGSKPEETAPTS